VLAAINDTGYRIVLVAHILFAIVGFGAVVLNGVYAAQMRSRKGPGALAIFEANFKVSKIGQYCIYVVFVLGLALVGMSDKAWKFDQTWIWLSITLYVIATGISHGLLWPRVRRVGVLMREMVNAGPPAGAGGPPPQALELEKIGPQLAMLGMTLNLFLVAILVLMVFRPGAGPGYGF
jgi:uncharacterized membrane protein